MSWWVSLNGPDGEPVSVELFEAGGAYAIGGSSVADLNITYNYGPRFREAWDGLGLREVLDGKRAADTLPQLDRAIEKLGAKPTADYWDAAPGNAGHALARLRVWARCHPDGTWSVR